jgi:GDP-fucose transporter C1
MKKGLIISLYMVLAIALVISNKKFLMRFKAPFATMWLQSTISALLTWQGASTGMLQFDRKLEFLSALKESFTVHAVGCMSLIFGSLALQEVDASVFQIVARSLTIPFSVIQSRYLLKLRPTASALIGAVVVTIGFVATVAIDSESTQLVFTHRGVLFGVIAAFVAALHSVVIKRHVSKGQSLSELELVFLGNVFFSLTTWPLLLAERNQIFRIVECFDNLLVFMAGSLFTATLAVGFNVAIMLQVNLTSPLTHTIMSAVRGVIQNLVCVLVLREPLTQGKVFGTATVLLGTLIYMRR